MNVFYYLIIPPTYKDTHKHLHQNVDTKKYTNAV